jgi:hypothetical protein
LEKIQLNYPKNDFPRKILLSNKFTLEPMAQAILVYSESPLNHALLWQNISVSALFCGTHCDEKKKINPNFETSTESPPTIKAENYVL